MIPSRDPVKPNQNEIIVDIGVENGSEIPEFCKAVGASGKVIAVEADPSCCRRIKKLKKILNLNNLTIIEHAVGDINKKEFVDLYRALVALNIASAKRKGAIFKNPNKLLSTAIIAPPSDVKSTASPAQSAPAAS